MAIERIIPTDWSRSTTSSDHSNITNYGNALTNTDSTTYGYFFYAGSGYSYLKFNASALPSAMNSVSFKIKAVRAGGTQLTASTAVEHGGTTYESETVSISDTLATYDLPLPSGVTLSQLRSATAIYIKIHVSSTQINVYGAEMDADTTAYKIFNLILPRG